MELQTDVCTGNATITDRNKPASAFVTIKTEATFQVIPGV